MLFVKTFINMFSTKINLVQSVCHGTLMKYLCNLDGFVMVML